MSYNQKPPGSSGSGMGGGPPNGPNNMPQVAKTFAGIQQQMQNLVQCQNALPQSQQAAAFLQQQRIQNMLKQQQQFLQFQHQMQQQQQHQQQQQQHHNMAGGGGVGPGPVSGVPGGVAGPCSSVAAGSGEPLALTRTAGAAELLNKTYQEQANGNPAANPTFNQLQQTLQALPSNFVQHLQVFQYQMHAKQMQQQQHGGGQGQHGHGQQQPVQGVPPPPTAAAMPHQQQQQQQQKHQNQQQQQQNAFSRYLTAAAVQAAAASGNKMSSVTPPPPPLTNQMKPPNLPPNTQITPVTAANITGSGNTTAGPHSKMSAGNTNTGSAKHSAPPPSISLTPSKAATSLPSVAHQQNKFTPPTNSGAKAGHIAHSQNLPKSTHGATHTATSNTTSPAKTGANADATVAALKSPQSTPVQLTKQMPPTTTTAATGNKTLASATATTAGATSSTVSPHKPATAPITVSASNTSNPSTTSASVGLTTATTSIATETATSTKPSVDDAVKPAVAEESSTAKILPKQASTEKETTKSSVNEIIKPTSDSSEASAVDGSRKEIDKPKERKTQSDAAVKKPPAPPTETKNSVEKVVDDLKTNTSLNNVPNKTSATVSAPLESTEKDKKEKSPVTSNQTDNHDVIENEKNLLDNKKAPEKNKPTTTEENKSAPLTSSSKDDDKNPEPLSTETKKAPADLSQAKNSQEEKKVESKEKESEKDKVIKSNKSSGKIEQTENAAPKDIQKAVVAADKPLAVVETKTTQIKIAQNITDKTLKKDETNDKKAAEANKKDASENGDQNKKEEKQPVGAVIKKEPTKSNVLPESKNEVLPKEKETSSLIPSKTTEKADTIEKSTKTPSSQTAANIKNSEDNIKEIVDAASKETVTAILTPVKKVGRHPKVGKTKSVSAASAGDSKTAETKEEIPTPSSARVKRKPKVDSTLVSYSSPSTPKDDDSDRKSKRHRLKTILYQSPLPELAYITKLSASEASNSPKPMTNEDRLIVFYKNEYMAVRNAEGTFYLCQTMQNVYRTSPRISIRWLSEDTNDNNVFIPDFYDHTDIECVLTTVELKRIDKGHLRLPKGERNRIESILKKAIDVEKGIAPRPELTEENPDGLDLSLFKDESQIEKKSALTEGNEGLTTSLGSGRKSRRGAASSARKSVTAASTSSGYKRKRDASSNAKSSSSSRKSTTKKRKTLLKRKRKNDHSDDDDDEDETSDDSESDAEYKPTQKRASLNVSGTARSAPRAQRSPLAKARAASPITPTTSRSKNVPQKTTPTPSTSKASRGERAAKRKSLVDAGSSEESSTPVKKPTTTSNNKVKGTLKKSKH